MAVDIRPPGRVRFLTGQTVLEALLITLASFSVYEQRFYSADLCLRDRFALSVCHGCPIDSYRARRNRYDAGLKTTGRKLPEISFPSAGIVCK